MKDGQYIGGYLNNMKRYTYSDISVFASWNVAEGEEWDDEDIWNFHITLRHCGLFGENGLKRKEDILDYLFNI